MSRTHVSLLRRTIAVAICAAMALACLLWPSSGSAQGKAAKPPRPLDPGSRTARLAALPSRSGRSQKDTGGVGHARRAACNFRPSGCRSDPEADDPIKPCGIVREIVFLGLYTQDVYAPVIRHLEQTGYRENRDLFVFDYDWRRSVFDNADALDRFVREKVPDGKVDILAHSMGALVARVYVMEGGGAAACRAAVQRRSAVPGLGQGVPDRREEDGARSITAMGGLDGFRRTILSFPSVFELMPRYGGCCDAGRCRRLQRFEGEDLERPALGRRRYRHHAGSADDFRAHPHARIDGGQADAERRRGCAADRCRSTHAAARRLQRRGPYRGAESAEPPGPATAR